MQNGWTPYPRIPWILYAPCGCQKGGYFIFNQRTKQQFHAPDMDGVHQYAADNSGNGLGNAVHRVTQTLGIQRCGSCAKRQAALNRLFR